MKKLMLCISVLGLFSCSSAIKQNEPVSRDVSSSIEEQKIVELFKGPYVEFNNKAYVIQQKANLKLQKFENNADVKSCREDSIAKRFFTNACTRAVELCHKTKMNAFTDLDAAFVSSIYSMGLGISKYADKLAKENKSYNKLSSVAQMYVERMKYGRDDIIEEYFNARSLLGFDILLGKTADTYDKKDDFVSCAGRLSDEAGSGSFDLWKAKYASLIPK